MDKPWNIDITVYADEDALVDGLRRHDRMACTCLLKRFAPRLYRVALNLMGSSDDADDVLQEGFIQACGQIHTFEGRSGLGSWLHRIVVNAALMRLRRRQHPSISLDQAAVAAESVFNDLATHLPAPDQHVLTDELRHRLEQAILGLPDSLRAVVVLRDIEGLSTSAAAAALQISQSALKVRLHRAHGALRTILAPYVRESMAHEEDVHVA